MSLTLDEIIACHERGIRVDRDQFMDFLATEMPDTLEFMYEVKGTFGSCSMPRLSRPRRIEPTEEVIEYNSGFISPLSLDKN